MKMSGKKFSIWLIGPSAAGKTTVSKLLYEKLNKSNLVLIDGDKIRTLYENNLGYDKISRSKNTYRYINLVNWLMNYNISSIVAVISPFQKDRVVCRQQIKNYEMAEKIYQKINKNHPYYLEGQQKIVFNKVKDGNIKEAEKVYH